MKILLYTEFEKQIGKSGLGKAIRHQMRALEENNIPYTTNPKDDYDIAHINWYGPGSYHLAKKAHRMRPRQKLPINLIIILSVFGYVMSIER